MMRTMNSYEDWLVPRHSRIDRFRLARETARTPVSPGSPMLFSLLAFPQTSLGDPGALLASLAVNSSSFEHGPLALEQTARGQNRQGSRNRQGSPGFFWFPSLILSWRSWRSFPGFLAAKFFSQPFHTPVSRY